MSTDYKEAKRELSDTLERLGIFATSDHTPASDTTERGPCRFRWTLHKGEASFSGTYQTGSAVPLHAYRESPDGESFTHRIEGGTWQRSRWWSGMPFGASVADIKAACKEYHVSVDGATIRSTVRRRYRPATVDIVASLLVEASSVEGHRDWMDWADEFGALDGATPAKLRELRNDFDTIHDNGANLRRFLGAEWGRAMELALDI